MNTGQIIKSRTTDRFTVITNTIAQSKSLTLEEKGLLVFLLSLPSDWVLYKTNLHEHLGEQKGTIDRVWRSLQEKGYVLSVKSVSTEGKFTGWNHIVYDMPTISDDEIRDGGKPTPTNADVGKSAPIQRTNLNTNTKEDTKKEEEDMYDSFISAFNDITGKKFRGDSKSKVQFKARLKEGYTQEDFIKAIRNCKNDDHHIKTGLVYLTPEFITRPDKLSRFINSAVIVKKFTPPI